MRLRFLVLFIGLLSIYSCSYEERERTKRSTTEVKQNDSLIGLSLDSKRIFRIDTFIKGISSDNDLSGAFLFAIKDSIYSNAFGKARHLDGPDVKQGDVFQIASVSKFVTAICVLKLVEDKKIKLTDRIADLIPGFNYKGITVHHLLTHSSGLPEYMYFTDNAWKGDTNIKTNQDAYCVLNESHEPAYFRPGKQFNYINSNYMLLAHIIELKTSGSFQEAVARYIVEPAGLDSLHVYQKSSRSVEDYPVWGMRGDHSFIPDNSLNHIVGDKGVYANVFDLYKLKTALLEGKILKEESLNLLLTPHMQVKFVNPQYYCYGLRKETLSNGETWYFHNGWWHGFRSYFWFNLEKDKFFVLLTNRLKGGFMNTKEMVKLLQD